MNGVAINSFVTDKLQWLERPIMSYLNLHLSSGKRNLNSQKSH